MTGACLNEMNKQAHASQPNGNISSQNNANLHKQAKGALSKHQQLVESLLADQEMDSSNRSLLINTLRAAVLLNHEIACMSGDAGAQLKLITTSNLSADEVAQMADESAQRKSRQPREATRSPSPCFWPRQDVIPTTSPPSFVIASRLRRNLPYRLGTGKKKSSNCMQRHPPT